MENILEENVSRELEENVEKTPWLPLFICPRFLTRGLENRFSSSNKNSYFQIPKWLQAGSNKGGEAIEEV